MGGRASRRKGYEGEREWATLTGGKRVPLSGALEEMPGDVRAHGLLWQVKRKASAWKTLYGLLDGPEDALALRADRQPWLVVMTYEKFLEVMGCGREDG